MAAFTKNRARSLLNNILIGIIGGGLSGIVCNLSAIINGGLIESMMTAAIGAGVLLYGFERFKNANKSSVHFKGDELWIRRKPLSRR